MLKSKQGFTLLEMSIVLVIIAFIIGGMLVSKTMIRSSRLQTVIADADRYKKAIGLFKEKYKELPGDMPNATSFWGTDPGGCPSTPANAVVKTTTCNGNGDSFIGDATGTPLGTAT